MRPSGRELNQMREVSIETNVTKHAEGSCLIKMGDTHVLCTASLEDRVPPFIRGTGLGWGRGPGPHIRARIGIEPTGD